MDTFISELIKGMGAIVAPFIAFYIVNLLRKAAAKAKIDLSASQQEALLATATRVVVFVEEWAAARVKEKIPTNSGDKYAKALAALVDKVPGITGKEADELIHVALVRAGLGATSFLHSLAEKTKEGE